MSKLPDRFLKKKRPKVTTTARKRRAPITVPAIALIGTPRVGEAEGEEVGPAVEPLVVDVEALEVEDGDKLFRQVLSSVAPTILMSELPP